MSSLSEARKQLYFNNYLIFWLGRVQFTNVNFNIFHLSFKKFKMSLDVLWRVRYKTFHILTAMGTAASVLGINFVPHVFPTKIKCLQSVPENAQEERHKRLLNEACCKMNIDSNKILLCYSTSFSAAGAGCLQFPGMYYCLNTIALSHTHLSYSTIFNFNFYQLIFWQIYQISIIYNIT